MAKRANDEVKPDNENTSTPKSNIPAYLDAALRISSSYPLGANLPNPSANRLFGYTNSEPAPGYAVLEYVPTLGVSKDATSALNRASFDTFNIIRAQISGNRPYEPADHMIYRACVDGMRELYHYVRRIYGVVRKYSATNLYRPRMALTAMGLAPDNWINNASALYQWLLNHKGALTPFPTVKIGSISDRHIAFNSLLFSDGGIDSSQTYIMNQKAFWSYEVVDQVKGITCRAFPATFEEFTTMWNEMYRALQNSSDVYIIAADIRRAFGDNVITDLPDTPVDYEVEYVEFDPVKRSIMNAILIGSDVANTSEEVYAGFRIYDEDGIVKCTPKFKRTVWDADSTYRVCYQKNYFNSIESEPSPSAVLEDVRLMPVVRVTRTGTVGDRILTTEIESMSTEVVTNINIVYLDASNGAHFLPASACVITTGPSDDEPNAVAANLRNYIANVQSICEKISSFDWHPGISCALLGIASNTITSKVHVEDYQNIVPVSDYQLSAIHDALLLAEFNVG